MSKKAIYGSLLALSSVLIFSCPGTTNSEGSGTSGVVLAAPQGLSGQFHEGGIRVVWQEVADAESYEVYRKDGPASSFELIDSVSQISYTDSSYPKHLAVQYAVKSISGTVPVTSALGLQSMKARNASSRYESPMSDPTESLMEWLRDVSASKMEHIAKIQISWKKQGEAEKYVLYRAEHKNFTQLEEIARLSTQDSLVKYDDVPSNSGIPALDTPYYYQVRWIKEGREYAGTSPLQLGLYSLTVDIGEPWNNDIQTLSGGTFQQTANAPPIIYSFGDGQGGVEIDTDWYKYEGKTGEAVSVEIVMPESFSEGALLLQFSYNDILSSPREFSKSSPQEIYNIPDPDNLREDTSLYFKIYPKGDNLGNLIGTYSVTVSNSL